ncbi:MAG: PEP-CTERM sorting domain-containing protein [Planctomycetaceae bacterium]|nr:MAG: PEP-CTERM sorting domain-containing protein [Planctomycetaceae bacterium]
MTEILLWSLKLMTLRNTVRAVLGVLLTTVVSAAAHAGPINVIPNGNFEQGNTLFSSDYAYSPASNPVESQYAVLTSPHPWNPNFITIGDHTTGSGLMFVGNGSPNLNDRVWFANGINVTPATNYFFEAFVLNVDDTTKYPAGANPSTFSNLSFFVNGTLLGTRQTSLLGAWEGLSTHWNSGNNTLVDLEIRNSNSSIAGNDFAIDDIYLGGQSTVTPTSVPEPSTLVLATLACAGAWAGRRARSTPRQTRKAG